MNYSWLVKLVKSYVLSYYYYTAVMLSIIFAGVDDVMGAKWIMLLMMVAITAACPVLDNRCFCHYDVETPRSIRLQFITCSNMGLRNQVPAFDVSYEQTEMLLVKNTTIIRLQSQAFAYVKSKHLIVRDLGITVVDHLVFGGLEQILISIDLGDNNISHVPYDAFFRLTKLTTLKLDCNRITALDKSTFRGMLQLRHIDLSNNLLQHLPSVIFRDLLNLQILELQGNSEMVIPEGLLANLRNLEVLDLSDNGLTAISSDAFASLTNLRHLNLSGNKFTGTLTSSFLHRLGNLIKLNISRNDVSALSFDAFHGCRQLIVVDLSSNRLAQVQPGTFSAMTSLELLDLSTNLIESIPDDLFDVNSSVMTLDLSNNALVNIGRFLINVSRLRRLDLSRNFLSEIPMSFFVNLLNLVYLDVRNNRLNGQLDGRLLPQLEVFLIDSNNVTYVELQNPSLRLVRLTISSNSLTKLPRLFHAPELTLLDVTHNDISAVSDKSFMCCKSLRQLHLSNNRITNTSVGAFHGLSLLTEIDLSDNRLRYLSTGLFASCSALSVINLSYNQLTAIDVGTFAGPTNLRKLDMSWNRLTTLTTNLIHEVLLTLVHLSLSGNPLHCDCQLTWLTTYSALLDHNTTICCPQQDFRPAVCRHVVCGSPATCPPIDTASTPPVRHSSLCAQTVPSSVIDAMFQQLTTSSPSTHAIQMTSVVDDTSSRVQTLTSSQTVDVITNSTSSTVCCAAASPESSANVNNLNDCIIAIAVVVPLLAVGLILTVTAIVCMRRRSFVDWSDEDKKCPARAMAVSHNVNSDCVTESDVVITNTITELSPRLDADVHIVVTPPTDDGD